MSAGATGAGLADLLADEHGLAGTLQAGQLTVDVPAEAWLAAAGVLRHAPGVACGFFDWLSAYEEGAGERAGALAVVCHVASLPLGHHVLLRTAVPAERPRLPSVTSLWAGAGWHERETSEMFGVAFDGHPGLAPLLLDAGAGGAAPPLRKAVRLPARTDRPWPGAHDPSGRTRRRPSPPGS